MEKRPALQRVPDRIAGRGAEAEARLRAHSKRAESLTMIAQKNPVSVKKERHFSEASARRLQSRIRPPAERQLSG